MYINTFWINVQLILLFIINYTVVVKNFTEWIDRVVYFS